MTAEEFNALYPVGTAVIYTDDHGKEHHTNTRSIAWALGHGEAVVKLLGRTSGHSLERVKALEPVSNLEIIENHIQRYLISELF